jgi:hypothetical protein
MEVTGRPRLRRVSGAPVPYLETRQCSVRVLLLEMFMVR